MTTVLETFSPAAATAVLFPVDPATKISRFEERPETAATSRLPVSKPVEIRWVRPQGAQAYPESPLHD